jgi:hypothetical protein
MELTRVTVEISQVLRSNLSRYQLQLLDHLVDIYRSYEPRDNIHDVAVITDASVVDRGRRSRRSDDGDHATSTTTAPISLCELTTSLAVLRLSIACCEDRRTLRCIVDDK